MSHLLEWRSAGKRDREALDTFQCTDDPHKSFASGWKRVHPKFWELEVQSAIRGLEPPYKYPKRLLIGTDAQGIGAVSHYEEVDGPARVELSLMAVSTRLRNQGGGYADEMFRVTREIIEARAIERGFDEVELVGYVWHENHASQRMCREAGLQHTRNAAEGVQVWTAKVPVGAPEELSG